jgi:uncharacterized protein involved in exopolysaccharide biosynthesis
MPIRRTKILGFTLLLARLALGGVGLWLLLSPAQYQATVTIALRPDGVDINGTGQEMDYNPYFLQTELEILKSPNVLGKVVEALNLNVEWGKKHGDGSPLKTSTAIGLLQRHMKLEPVRNTTLVKISFFSADPKEAARIANAIAKACHDYRLERHRQLTIAGIKALEEKYQEEEEQIRVVQTNVDLLRKKFKIPTNDLPTQSQKIEALKSHEAQPDQPYWEAKRKLENMIELHKLLAARIETEKIYLSLPKTSMVEITTNAEPPQFPASPNRPLGAVLLVIGLLPTIVGFILLKSSNRKLA